jgi:hypothetical protein
VLTNTNEYDDSYTPTILSVLHNDAMGMASVNSDISKIKSLQQIQINFQCLELVLVTQFQIISNPGDELVTYRRSITFHPFSKSGQRSNKNYG